MSRGKHVRALRPDQIARLEAFRKAPHPEDGAPHGYSLSKLRLAMGVSFGIETLSKALAGLSVWDLHHTVIAAWIERYLPPPKGAAGIQASEEAGLESQAALSSSQKGAGALTDPASEEGEADGTDEKKAGTTRTIRGSR